MREALVFTVAVAVLIVGLFLGIPAIKRNACEQTADVMGVPYKWGGAFVGCFIEIDGEWIPLRSYRAVQP